MIVFGSKNAVILVIKRSWHSCGGTMKVLLKLQVLSNPTETDPVDLCYEVEVIYLQQSSFMYSNKNIISISFPLSHKYTRVSLHKSCCLI